MWVWHPVWPDPGGLREDRWAVGDEGILPGGLRLLPTPHPKTHHHTPGLTATRQCQVLVRPPSPGLLDPILGSGITLWFYRPHPHPQATSHLGEVGPGDRA